MTKKKYMQNNDVNIKTIKLMILPLSEFPSVERIPPIHCFEQVYILNL